MKFIFFDNNKENINALIKEVEKYPELLIHCEFIFSDIIDLVKNYNKYILVSPSNCFGSMKGGIDKIINKYIFKNIEEKVMKTIENNCNNKFPYNYYFDGMNIKNRPYLLVGESFLVKDYNNYLAVVPTMTYPMVVYDTENAYLAMKSLLNTLNNSKLYINNILIPCFCTGIGEMSPENMAYQMLKALNEQFHQLHLLQ